MQIDAGLVLRLESFDRTFDAADIPQLREQLGRERRSPGLRTARIPCLLDLLDVVAEAEPRELLRIERPHARGVERYLGRVSRPRAFDVVRHRHVSPRFHCDVARVASGGASDLAEI